ncbi:MAG: J domain-containing protein [Candidatus Rokubacteria bacterium]|nr:J domain-containing protein [Candidatus Rokubacteria bacterium]
MRRDYYAVLGITATAAPREVRQAYRRLARQYSPDVNFWDDRARSLFDEIAEAYRVLSDPAARDMYDRYGSAPGASEALPAGRRGDDVHVAVELSFAEVARGATLTVRVARYSPCRACGARGRTGDAACALCGARGVARVTEPVTVSVPPGVDSGVQLRVTEEGSAGPFGGPRGDLIVSTRVTPHPFFERKGDNVHCEVPISVWEALRGARIKLPTPQGEAAIAVPPGTASGTVFRLRGQGLPSLARDGAGDLHVTVRIEMPEGLDARTDELVRSLERLLPLEPRFGLEKFRGGAA